MAKRANTGIKNSVTDSFAALFNSGKLRIYTGSQPASGDDAASGTLLVEITLPNPAFGAASGGVASKAGTWQANATASGTAGWARKLNGALSMNIDYAVTITGGGGDMEVQNTNIASGQQVTVTTATLTGLSGA
jgi:hypothetical protein